MGARSGNNYLSVLKKLGADLWLDDTRVADATTHPVLRSRARLLASLYDMQLESPEAMTYRTDDGGRAGLAFLQPVSDGELRRRTRMMWVWADYTGGFIAHTPDFCNVSIAAMAAAHEFLGASDPRFGGNILRYYREARGHDRFAIHAFADSNQIGAAESARPARSERAVRLTSRGDNGIVVSGSTAVDALAPFAEELIVLPTGHLPDEPEAERFALSFAVPTNIRGIRLECRTVRRFGSGEAERSLSRRLDDFECVAVLDNIVIPWNRVFLCGAVARYNALLDETGARAHQTHQDIVRRVARGEFVLGLTARIIESSGLPPSDAIRERLAESIAMVEAMRTHLHGAEADAAADRWGVFAPALAPLQAASDLIAVAYPRMVETVELTCAWSLAASSAAGAAPSAAAADAVASDRIAMFRLAREIADSVFAARPQGAALSPFEAPDLKEPIDIDRFDLRALISRVDAFLARPD
jgi:4-hydroxyphenylacetate 3-monooxygenase